MRRAEEMRTVGRRLRRLGPCVLLLGLVGCVPESSPAFDNDPLFGGPRLPRNASTAALPKPTGAAGAPLQVPPPSGAAGPAALASAPPVDAGGLRIGPPPGVPTSAPHDGGDPWHSAGPAAGVTLQQPAADPAVQPSAVIAPPTAGAATAAGQYEQLQDMLAQRGVQFQALEGPDGNGLWRFRCGVPAKGDPNSTHNIEASAAGENGLAAVRGAISLIDQYQRQGQ